MIRIKKLLLSLALCASILFVTPTTSSAATFEDWQYANAFEVYKVLHAEGYTNAGICGILANMMIESRMNPTSGNDTFYGLCAWGYGRAAALRSTEGCDTAEGQARFLASEVNEMTELKEILTTTTDAHYAAERFCRIFERPANPNMTPRYNYADVFMEFLSGIPSISNFHLIKDSTSMHIFGMKWEHTGSITGYEIQYSSKEDFSEDVHQLLVDNPSANMAFVDDAVGDTKYFVRIRPLYNMNGSQMAADWSPTISTTTDVDPFVYCYKAHIYYADRIQERVAEKNK